MTTPTELVLSLLEGVRRTGRDRWLACCPAHEDRTPSLSIREGDDGRVLLYCFAGCGSFNVLDAIRLEMPDLYPERLGNNSPSNRRRVAPRIPARDALELLEYETIVVEIVAHRLAKGEPIEDHRDALEIAASRIAAIREAWMSAP